MTYPTRAPVPSHPSAQIHWDEDDILRSTTYEDVYFSRDGGLEESRTVFLTACGLPGRWKDHDHFTVAELGFGSGLNILALLELWDQTRPPDARLSIYSIEAHPLRHEDAARIHAHFPELARLSPALLQQWPGRAGGLHRIDFPSLNAQLDVHIGEADQALDRWSGQADAWFLDGFAPARNPAMWSADVMQQIARLSRPGVRLATYTVARQVRDNLHAAGFEFERRPGFGRKRERLEAWLPAAGLVQESAKAAPHRKSPESPPDAIVIGAGIAGASIARALRAQGLSPRVWDSEGPGSGASGNPAAMLAPRLDAGDGLPTRLFARCFARSRALIRGDCPQAILSQGIWQAARTERDPGRFARIAASPWFEPEDFTVNATAWSTAFPRTAARATLVLETALVIDPVQLVQHWCAGMVRRGHIADIRAQEDHWNLIGPKGEVLDQARRVFVANGPASGRLTDLQLRAVRGQLEYVQGPRWSEPALMAGGYVIPAPGGFIYGATHDRDQTTLEPRDEDRQRNLDGLDEIGPVVSGLSTGATITSRVSIRAASRDQNPVAGEIRPGLFVLTGLGSRGFCTAPLLAEHIVAQALDRPSPLETDLARFVDPARFSGNEKARPENPDGL